MQTKPDPLRDAMLGVQSADAPRPVSVVSVVLMTQPTLSHAKMAVAASRVGKRSISGHVNPDVQKQLRRLAVDLDRSHQSLLDEALNDLFRKYNVSAIA